MDGSAAGSLRNRPYQAPRLTGQVIARPRLTNRLHSAIGAGLTLIQAPAGCGKSTLIAQFAAEVDFETRWLSLDRSCRAPEVLAERIARALTNDLEYPGPAVAGDIANLRAFLGAAVRCATSACERPLLLVLDSFQEITASDETGELLNWLLQSLPDGTEVIIASRTPVDLEDVDDRVLSGQVDLVGVGDLVFTEDEITQLAAVIGSTTDVHEVFESTGGWPVGAMAILRGALRGNAGRRLEMSEAWERYIVREVWEGIPTDIRRALLSLSIAPVIDGQIGAALIGQHAWWQLHDWLTGHDLLVEHLDGGAIRLNGLFRQFLVARFRRLHPAEYESAFQLIIESFESTGALAEAIQAASAAENSTFLISLIEKHGHALFNQGAFSVLMSAFDAISARDLQHHQLLQGLRARTLAHAGSPVEALAAADSLLRVTENPVARHHAALARRRVLRLMGRVHEVGAMLLPDPENHPPLLQAEIAYAEAELEGVVRGNYDRAMPLLRHAADLAQAGEATSLELLARATLGEFMAARGEMPAAIHELTRAAQGWRAIHGTANLGWTLNNLGFAHLAAGDFESAVTVLTEAVAEGEQCGNTRNSTYARASLAEAKTALGRYKEAVRDYEEILRLCSTIPDGTLACASMIGFSAAALGAGDVPQADYLARQALVLGESLQMPVYHALAIQQVAMVLLHTGDVANAVGHMEEASGLLDSTQSTTERLVAYYRLGMCYFRANRRQDAARALTMLDEMLAEPWMAGPLIPAAREQPMFAQWAASRPSGNVALKAIVERGAFRSAGEPMVQDSSSLPVVQAESLGRLRVVVGGKEVGDDAWASARAKEMFFLLLAHRNGIRKEEAVEHLYPELAPEKCNSAFHSNLYRVRKALYQDSVVKRDGTYLLNPAGIFDWDVQQFEEAMAQAGRFPAGSQERAKAHEHAIALYRGPFAEMFYSEWAASLRRKIDSRSLEAITLLAGFHAGREEFELAAATLERILELDDFNVEAMYDVAVYRAKAGHGAGAIKFIDSCRDRWREEYEEELPDRFSFLRASIASGKAV